MAELVLSVWMDGFSSPAGYLARREGGETGFIYDDDYVSAGGLPLSLSLPLERGEFGDVETRAYFANLLPENTQLQRIMDREALTRDDAVGLLYHLGADCAGAVSCLPLGAPQVKSPGDLSQDYEALDDRQLENIVRSLYERRRLPDEVTDPSPVAGVQGKIALTLLPDGSFALPSGGKGVPTTHILKVPERGQGRDARLEEAAALLAMAAGLDVSVPTALRVGDMEALLIERFDRQVVGGKVLRLHQEDFAQALGLPADLKYQRNGREGRWFDVAGIVSVLDRTIDPLSARRDFLLTTLFNLCIGNTDNHAKNHAVLYDRGPTPRFAPLYDLLPIRLNGRYTHDLAFQIGAAKTFDTMTTEDLGQLLAAFGIHAADVPSFVTRTIQPMIERLESATRTMRSGAGMKSFDDLMGRELEQVVELLGFEVKIRERDYFPAEGIG